METITSKHLRDKDNHTSCECGNKTIYEYMWTDHNGDSQSCPLCMVEWQSSQIKAMKELIYELSSKSKEETANAINQKYAELMICEVDDFIDDVDYRRSEQLKCIMKHDDGNCNCDIKHCKDGGW